MHFTSKIMYLYFIQSLQCLIEMDCLFISFQIIVILNLFYSELKKQKNNVNGKDRCSIGLKNKEICHKQTYVKTKEI